MCEKLPPSLTELRALHEARRREIRRRIRAYRHAAELRKIRSRPFDWKRDA